ncbi:uncharacterized protein Aud_003856 [Aspergillus udagawae]|uniref:Uncharacterized protein n=1 Tax=Aspergillus udagawae TaxID=91492 RepID=A0A8E0QNT6_9EURO|nr:uncharacterized protein Aud_003856 [Aspergillus udagawae]GIC87472.1 hypothetical protein Aud_003856 [Aspergillus udagawae]
MEFHLPIAADLYPVDGGVGTVVQVWDAFLNVGVSVANEVIHQMAEVGESDIIVVFMVDFLEGDHRPAVFMCWDGCAGGLYGGGYAAVCERSISEIGITVKNGDAVALLIWSPGCEPRA